MRTKSKLWTVYFYRYPRKEQPRGWRGELVCGDINQAKGYADSWVDDDKCDMANVVNRAGVRIYCTGKV